MDLANLRTGRGLRRRCGWARGNGTPTILNHSPLASFHVLPQRSRKLSLHGFQVETRKKRNRLQHLCSSLKLLLLFHSIRSIAVLFGPSPPSSSGAAAAAAARSIGLLSCTCCSGFEGPRFSLLTDQLLTLPSIKLRVLRVRFQTLWSRKDLGSTRPQQRDDVDGWAMGCFGRQGRCGARGGGREMDQASFGLLLQQHSRAGLKRLRRWQRCGLVRCDGAGHSFNKYWRGKKNK